MNGYMLPNRNAAFSIMVMQFISLYRSRLWGSIVLLSVLFHTATAGGFFLFNWYCRNPIPQSGSYSASSVKNVPNILDASNTEAFIHCLSVSDIGCSEYLKVSVVDIRTRICCGGWKNIIVLQRFIGACVVLWIHCHCDTLVQRRHRFEMLKLLDWVAPSKLGNVLSIDTLGIRYSIDQS